MPQQRRDLNSPLARPRHLVQRPSTQDSNNDDIKQVIGRVHRELQLLQLERAAILKRIGVITRTIAGLAEVFGTDVVDDELQSLLSKRSTCRTIPPDPGLTDVCRRMLMEFSEPVTTRQLCSRIQETNPSVLARQKQPTTSVTVVLRRLTSYGEVKDCVNDKGGRAWLWIGSGGLQVVDNSALLAPKIAMETANPSQT